MNKHQKDFKPETIADILKQKESNFFFLPEAKFQEGEVRFFVLFDTKKSAPTSKMGSGSSFFSKNYVGVA
jgi:hypothetical protein